MHTYIYCIVMRTQVHRFGATHRLILLWKVMCLIPCPLLKLAIFILQLQAHPPQVPWLQTKESSPISEAPCSHSKAKVMSAMFSPASEIERVKNYQPLLQSGWFHAQETCQVCLCEAIEGVAYILESSDHGWNDQCLLYNLRINQKETIWAYTCSSTAHLLCLVGL